MPIDANGPGGYIYEAKRAEERRQEEQRQRENLWQIGAANGDQWSATSLRASGKEPWYTPPKSSSSKVICTYLVGAGQMSGADYELCFEDSKARLTAAHYRGYHLWAVPVVRIMRRSPRVARIFQVLAQARVDEIAARRGQSERGNLLGKLLIAVAEPLCAVIGRVAPATDYRMLYRDTAAKSL